MAELEQMSPEELAVAAQNGQRECFELLTERLRPRLHSFLLQRTAHPEDADDLTQEAFLRAYDQLERYDARWRFSTWLFTIASRLAVSHHRAARPAAELREASAPAAEAGADPARRRDGRRLWQRASEVLKEREYEALYLRYAEDLKVREVAARMGLTVVHAKVLLYRARRRLATEVS